MTQPAVEAALAGCTDAEGAALMGHGSPHSFATYRRQAPRIRLSEGAAAKIAALRERTKNADVKNDLENGCKTEGPIPERSQGPETKKARSLRPFRDGTASPVRTGDLQSHNLAL